jgi:NAD-dependent DNA ligase
MTLQELIELKKELTRHDYRYYILFNPIITDQKYDMLYKEYEAALIELIGKDTRSLELEGCYPQWVRDEFKGVKPRT